VQPFDEANTMSPIVYIPCAELSIGITSKLCGSSSAIGVVNHTSDFPLPIALRFAIGFISPLEGILTPNVVLISIYFMIFE
jgi:hypothetical protein